MLTLENSLLIVNLIQARQKAAKLAEEQRLALEAAKREAEEAARKESERAAAAADQKVAENKQKAAENKVDASALTARERKGGGPSSEETGIAVFKVEEFFVSW